MSLFKRNKWLKHAVQILLLLGIVFAVRLYMQTGVATGAAPPLEGRLLDGTVFNLAAHNKRPLVVHFWATWCPICKAEHSTISALSRDYPLISIAMRSGDKDAVTAYLHEHSLDFPVIVDEEGVLAARYGVPAVPATFIIDENNRIAFVEVGYTTEIGLRLRLWWAS